MKSEIFATTWSLHILPVVGVGVLLGFFALQKALSGNQAVIAERNKLMKNISSDSDLEYSNKEKRVLFKLLLNINSRNVNHYDSVARALKQLEELKNLGVIDALTDDDICEKRF